MNVIISCYALSCWAQFCSVGCMMFMMLILTDSTLGAKGIFLFFLIPNSWRCGLFAKTMQLNDIWFGKAVLSSNI